MNKKHNPRHNSGERVYTGGDVFIVVLLATTFSSGVGYLFGSILG